MKGYIYIIKNTQNEKVYIGQTSRTIASRWNQHKTAALRNEQQGIILYNAIRKYGVECFYVSILEECELSQLNEREKYWISYYNSKTPNGYNVREGGEDPGRKEVYKIDGITNQIIECYGSAMSAAELNGLDLSHLTKVCRREEKSLGGFKWSYVENYDQDYLKLITVKKQNYPIYQMDTKTGQIVKKWKSIAEACSTLKIQQADISRCLSGKYKTAGGFGWCNDDTVKSYIPYERVRKVIQYDKNLNFIKKWNSAKEAGDFLDIDPASIRRVCSGKGKTCKGYIWKYEQEKIC